MFEKSPVNPLDRFQTLHIRVGERGAGKLYRRVHSSEYIIQIKCLSSEGYKVIEQKLNTYRKNTSDKCDLCIASLYVGLSYY